jgi:hypothetical protein
MVSFLQIFLFQSQKVTSSGMTDFSIVDSPTSLPQSSPLCGLLALGEKVTVFWDDMRLVLID